MPQSSLTAWLKKPAIAQDPLNGAALDKARESESRTLLPTPPTASPSPEDSKGEARNQCSDDAQWTTTPPGSRPKPTLPPQVELRKCTKDDISHLKRLNSLLLPIPYSESFYRDTVEDPITNSITLLAVWHDDPSTKGKAKGRLVGAIRGRLLACSPVPTPTQNNGVACLHKEGPMLYLSTLVLLSPYRSHGIAAHMLNTLVKRAVGDYGIASVGAHVWEANPDGLKWYRNRGFREVHREIDYYRRLQPSAAVVMQKNVSVMDLVRD